MTEIVGVDTGGTFTDLVGIDENGAVRIAKHPSTPKAPADAFGRVLERSGIAGAEIDRLVHGTTVAANAIIQRTGARLLFVTTSGFEDIPFLQRINRERAYDLHWIKPKPLVDRRNCIGVKERCDASGAIVTPLETRALEEMGNAIEARLRCDQIDAIAVCLLFSFVNSAHERAVGDFLDENFPDLLTSFSHQVAPVWREYERSSTVLADGFVRPLIHGYCRDLMAKLEDSDYRGPCALLKSNGGTTLPDTAAERPVELIFSGLAGGVVGGRYFATRAGFDNAITFDMGGTSCDVGLIIDGEQRFTTEFEIEWGLPVATPTIDVRTLGAGGGSIAWIDKGGLLNVGPQSAGADPGPACYGAGGTDPTVTDANLVLGRLSPDYFLGGEVALHPIQAEYAVDQLAEKLGASRVEAAVAIVEIAEENMTNAIRLFAIEAGIEPSDFVLVAFGGAGPLHAASVAEKLGIGTIVVPPHPGLCSAFGAAISERRVEKVHTFAARHQTVTDEDLRRRFDGIVKEAEGELRAEGLQGDYRCAYAISMRYYQQNYEEDIEYVMQGDGLAGAIDRFHERHQAFYGYHFKDETIELVHLKASLAEEKPLPRISMNRKLRAPAASTGRASSRTVHTRVGESVECRITRRGALAGQRAFQGPMIVEEEDSTTYLPSEFQLRIDKSDNLVMSNSRVDIDSQVQGAD